jgi:hypothetical protein
VVLVERVGQIWKVEEERERKGTLYRVLPIAESAALTIRSARGLQVLDTERKFLRECLPVTPPEERIPDAGESVCALFKDKQFLPPPHLGDDWDSLESPITNGVEGVGLGVVAEYPHLRVPSADEVPSRRVVELVRLIRERLVLVRVDIYRDDGSRTRLRVFFSSELGATTGKAEAEDEGEQVRRVENLSPLQQDSQRPGNEDLCVYEIDVGDLAFQGDHVAVVGDVCAVAEREALGENGRSSSEHCRDGDETGGDSPRSYTTWRTQRSHPQEREGGSRETEERTNA